MSGTRLYSQRNVNLHTHSFFCGHGTGLVEEYAVNALDQGLEALGYSEHCPTPDDRWPRSRMPFARLDEYTEACRVSQRLHGPLGRKDLLVLRGFECDYLPEYHSYYQEHLLGDLACDYLLFGVHYLQVPSRRDVPVHRGALGKTELYAYTDQYIASLRSGLFLFGAHPDLFAFNYRTWDADAISCSKAIIECAVDLGIPLEINGYGFRKPLIETPDGVRKAYPIPRFWELAAQYPLQVTTNSDAHAAADVAVHFTVCREFAERFGLKFVSVRVTETEPDVHRVELVSPEGE